MRLAYLLLFLLHLSAASTCHATSRNRHIFLNPGGAPHIVPAPLPAPIHDHRRIAKDLSYDDDVQYPYGMMAQGAPPPPPPPSLPGTDDVQPPDEEIRAAMAPSPSPSPSPPEEVDNGGYGDGEPGGGGDVGGGGDGEGGPSSDATDQEESVIVDYEAPKTHPPSNN